MHSFVPEPDSPYLTDESKLSGRADRVFFPENAEDLQFLFEEATEQGIPVTVNAARTGVCGGGVPEGGWVVSLERFPGIMGIGKDEKGYYVRTGPCVPVRELCDTVLMKRLDGLEDLTEDACGEFRRDPGKYFYPVDPTEMDGSIGGNIATNASGPRTLKYGPTRNWVKSIDVVFPYGRRMHIERGKHFAYDRRFDCFIDGIRLDLRIPDYDFNTDVKNAAGLYSRDGMDLIDLFIGSEGILGTIVQAEVRLTEWHPLLSCIMFMPDDGSALRLIRDIKHSDVSPEFLEYFDTGSVDLIRGSCGSDPTLLRPPDGKRSAVFVDLAMDGSLDGSLESVSGMMERLGGDPGETWVGHDEDDRRRMFEFRHHVPKAIFDYVAGLKGEMPAINKMGTDMSVPEGASDEMMGIYKRELDASGLEYVIFGHMGDCHPHVEIILKDMDDLAKAREVYDVLAEHAYRLGGSPSAEHGIGKLKRKYIGMMYGGSGIGAIQRIKLRFDPAYILNRGDMVD